MPLLLKIMPEALDDNEAIVPRMKSVALTPEDAGEQVFIWLGDGPHGNGALHAVARLVSFETLRMPQVRDPSKKKDAYRLVLETVDTEIADPLTTNDLGPYRYVEGADGIESLSRIHRDRNDKIIRLTSGETTVLTERFKN